MIFDIFLIRFDMMIRKYKNLFKIVLSLLCVRLAVLLL